MRNVSKRKTTSYYLLVMFFGLFILFLYGPMLSVFVLSFQGIHGSMTFPLRDASLHWFGDLFISTRYGDLSGSFGRSMIMGGLALIVTAIVCFFAGLAFRKRFIGSAPLFYLTIVSLVIPGLLLSFGIGQMFQLLGLEVHWLVSGVGAHLSWTLPFGLLIMFAVLSRFSSSWEEAARDAGATPAQVLRYVTLPILFPGIIAVALFGFTLSYDEVPRSLLTLGTRNTLPLQIANMTSSVTTPALYAIGTITTVVSLVIILAAFVTIAAIQNRRGVSINK